MSARRWTPPPPAEFAPLSQALRRQAHQRQHQAQPQAGILEMTDTDGAQEGIQMADKTTSLAERDRGDNRR